MNVECCKDKPKPELTSRPTGAVLSGTSVTLTCTLNTQSTGWKFYWNTSTQSTETETETHTHTIGPVGESRRGRYQCRAGRGNPVYYTHYSDALWVNVTEKPKPELTSSPTGAVLSGTSVTLTCTLNTQSTGWTFYWNTSTQSTETETETHTHTIGPVGEYRRGRYQCRAGRGNPVYYTHYSDALWVNVTEKPKPELTSSPTGAVLSGTSVTLTCTLNTQSTGWTFYWNTSTQSTETETDTHTHTIGPVGEYRRGRYQCRAGRGNPVYYTHYSDALWVNVTGE
ncbi:carcinoembryonic antigen-related cell adhesion molecule 5-like [Clarias magur]|uniref:Carcinoembryonic antigen-related cell adhesion molecule 5-like n=1 Tax=Clarias magur TaxID=1594786 RepID=A0A8J4TWH2_CLAMG|nr:carcinoembryonic antigen-related cell adhesion molecule 5-like [Clarias magur]